MRRPWLMGIGAIIVALVAAFLFLAPTAPFSFLEGHRPVVHATFSDRQSNSLTKNEVLDYAFEADFDSTLREADRELRAQGYQPQSGDSEVMFVYMKSAPGRMPQRSSEVVVLRKDTRVTPDKAPRAFGRDAGWVSVQVMGRTEPSVIERIRMWIGV